MGKPVPWECLCIVQIGIKQQYGESPDTYTSNTVKAQTHIEYASVSECAERVVRENPIFWNHHRRRWLSYSTYGGECTTDA